MAINLEDRKYIHIFIHILVSICLTTNSIKALWCTRR